MPKLIKSLRIKLKLPPRPKCWICGKNGEWDHLRSRGAGGGNELSNLQPLCREHHTERHFIGIKTFVEKYHLPIDTSGIYPRRTDAEP